MASDPLVGSLLQARQGGAPSLRRAAAAAGTMLDGNPVATVLHLSRSDLLWPIARALSRARAECRRGLMMCFCARRLIDCAEDADAESFRAFMAQVESQKQSKLTHTFARCKALKAVLSDREQLGRALDAFESSKLQALRAALQHATCQALPSTPSASGGQQHGLIAISRLSRRPQRLARVCEESLAQLSGGAAGGATGENSAGHPALDAAALSERVPCDR